MWNNGIRDTANKMGLKRVWSAQPFYPLLLILTLCLSTIIYMLSFASRRWTTSGWRFRRRIGTGSWHEGRDWEVFAWKEEQRQISVIQPLSLAAVISITFFSIPSSSWNDGKRKSSAEWKQKLTLEIFLEFLLVFAKCSRPFFIKTFGVE